MRDLNHSVESSGYVINESMSWTEACLRKDILDTLDFADLLWLDSWVRHSWFSLDLTDLKDFIQGLIYVFGSCHHTITVLLPWDSPWKQLKSKPRMRAWWLLTTVNIQPPLDSFLHDVVRGRHIFKGLMLTHLRKTALAQRISQPLP